MWGRIGLLGIGLKKIWYFLFKNFKFKKQTKNTSSAQLWSNCCWQYGNQNANQTKIKFDLHCTTNCLNFLS